MAHAEHAATLPRHEAMPLGTSSAVPLSFEVGEELTSALNVSRQSVVETPSQEEHHGGGVQSQIWFVRAVHADIFEMGSFQHVRMVLEEGLEQGIDVVMHVCLLCSQTVCWASNVPTR